jgi:peptidoglycan hydrolase-like protein with peptidoglycan-binding domain
MKLNRKNILLEQSTWADLPQSDQQKYGGQKFLAVKNLFRNQTPPKDLRKFNNKLQSIDWDKSPNNPANQQTTTPSTGLNKYVGEYEGEGFLPSFSIKVTDGKLYASLMGGETELTNVSDNKFSGKVTGIDFEMTFELSGDSVVGGQVIGTVSGVSRTAKFKRKSINTNTNTSSTQTTSTKPPSPWDCIENFNKKFNQLGLWDRDEYRFEEVDLQHNGKDTIFMYYSGGSAVWAYYDNKKTIMTGSWECRGDEGYLIKWSNGVVSRYNTKDSGMTGQTNNNTNTTTDTLENPCINGYKDGCVSEEDILNKKKALKVCRKCDLVKKVQDNPEIKARIFRIQKELGKEQKTDNVFGPIMLKAIKEFQSSNGINPTGNVGEKTLTIINSYSEPKVNNNEPMINKTEVKNEPKINKTEVKTTNKAEVKPIYRRSSRQVLSPDEEL